MKERAARNRRVRRDGMTLVETLVALTLLGIAILMSVAVVSWARRLEARAERRAAALEVATNVAEQVRAAPYESVRDGRLDLEGEVLPQELEALSVETDVEEDEELGVKYVRVVVAWTHRGEERRVQLDTAIGRMEVYR